MEGVADPAGWMQVVLESAIYHLGNDGFGGILANLTLTASHSASMNTRLARVVM